MVSAVNERLLDERLAALEQARAWSPRLISRLESHIRSADDPALFRINAFSFAKERNLSETEIIDLFLHATALGIFSMDWSLYCPQCCCVVESFRSLKGLQNHYHCAFCQVGFEAALDEYIAPVRRWSKSARTARTLQRPAVCHAGSRHLQSQHRTDCKTGVCACRTP